MRNLSARWLAGTLTVLATSASSFAAPARQSHIPFPNLSVGLVKSATRGGSGLGKLSPQLHNLYEQVTRPKTRTYFTPAQLRERFGAESLGTQPHVLIAIRLEHGSSIDGNPLGDDVSVLRSSQTVVYARTTVASLRALCADSRVAGIDGVKPAAFPVRGETAVARIRPHIPTRGGDDISAFDHAGLTGKGVIVGIVDSGVDWKHKDLRNADGSTRILDLWDTTDDSWATSKGTIGSEPPLKDKSGAPIGTLYTKEQIDAALNGTGTVNSVDNFGHGTACAGTAAGNGLATGNGEPSGQYVGVAPEADLVIVKAGEDGASPIATLGTAFIVDTASKLGEPCIISHSFGSHDSGHNGTDAEDELLDDLAGPGKPGVVLCAAAGNEGREALHARARFGPAVDGQADVVAEAIELFVQTKTELDVYVNHADDWGIGIQGLDKFFIDANGKPDVFYVTSDGKNVKGLMDKPAKLPADFGAYFDTVQVQPSEDNKEDQIFIPLPPGHYMLYALGTGKDVPDGVADFYLPLPEDATFGYGADKQFMVCTPGDAANVITAGAYYFRHNWQNLNGQTTTYNLPDGDLCTYSNPGYRRDGTVKPEIAAPASFTISSLATGSKIGKDASGALDKTIVTADGVHIAWSGTSAASPYLAGVIALMLQKNPTLDEDQVRKILETTAKSDSFTGATPNPSWGYGKIDPAAAIAAVDAETPAATQ